MTSRRAFLQGLAGFSMAAGLAIDPAFAQRRKKVKTSKVPVPATAAGGRVIIMRGLANIFSRGMDEMAAKFIAAGVQVSLINHTHWKEVSTPLIEQYKTQKDVAPIILIGHSLGGDASLVMANWLGLNRVPVRLIVVFDAVAQLHPVVASVQEVVNYYKPKGYGREVKTTENFHGTVQNIDLTERSDIDHLNIDKDQNLQAEVMAKVFEILKVAPPQSG